jgi:hypothetical protein
MRASRRAWFWSSVEDTGGGEAGLAANASRGLSEGDSIRPARPSHLPVGWYKPSGSAPSSPAA